MWVRVSIITMSAIGLRGALTLAYPGNVSAADTPPQVSKDGLQLKIHTKNELVCVKPSATFNQFKRVMILDCYVAMAKDWQQNYNANEGGDLDLQVTDGDVQRIERTLSDEFKKVFNSSAYPSCASHGRGSGPTTLCTAGELSHEHGGGRHHPQEMG